MIENIRLSFKGIWSHKMRSVLTMLGIIIGIASIIAIISIIQSVSEMMKHELIGNGGDNTVSISLFDKDNNPYRTDSNGAETGIPSITDEKIQAVNSVDGVVDSSPFYQLQYVGFSYNNNSASGNVCGVEPEYFTLTNLYLKRGRLLTQEDYDNKNNVVVIDAMVANALFPGKESIGRTLSINGEIFVVVGVVDVDRNYENINTVSDYTIAMNGVQPSVYVPSTSWAQVKCYDDAQSLLVKIDNLEKTVAISDNVAQILNQDNTSKKYLYKSASIEKDASQLETVTGAISILLIGIAGISLIVGGIGVMNIMLVSVTERTREIGLKKALGARKKQILMQFLTEAAVLTGVGGMLGVLLGIGLAFILGFIFNMQIVVSFTAVIVSVAFSMGVGVVFGIMPSIKASKLDPIEALRYE